jgi:hypothetical protein
MFFGGIRRSIPSCAQGFGGLSSSHSSTAIGRGFLRRRIKYKSEVDKVPDHIGYDEDRVHPVRGIGEEEVTALHPCSSHLQSSSFK